MSAIVEAIRSIARKEINGALLNPAKNGARILAELGVGPETEADIVLSEVGKTEHKEKVFRKDSTDEFVEVTQGIEYVMQSSQGRTERWIFKPIVQEP